MTFRGSVKETRESVMYAFLLADLLYTVVHQNDLPSVWTDYSRSRSRMFRLSSVRNSITSRFPDRLPAIRPS